MPSLKISRFDAVDGRKVPLTPRVSHLFNTSMHGEKRRNPYEDHGWRRGALGCAMSHVQIWAEIASHTDLPAKNFYLILEDDARPLHKDDSEAFRSQFLRIYDLAVRDPRWDILYLGFTEDTDIYHDKWVSGWGKHAKQFSSALRSNGGSTFAYALRRSGALKLLERANADHIHEPIDWFMIDMFGNDKDSLVAYKTVPHVFVNPKSSADRSTTEQSYAIAESDLMMAKWNRECQNYERSVVSNITFDDASRFKVQFVKPTGVSKTSEAVDTTSDIRIQIELILDGSMSTTEFLEFHKCSKACYFLQNIRDEPKLVMSKAQYCTPVFQRFRDAYIENVALWKLRPHRPGLCSTRGNANWKKGKNLYKRPPRSNSCSCFATG